MSEQARRDLTRLTALNAIRQQCRANDERWGHDRVLSDLLWCAVAAEEFGEIMHEILWCGDKTFTNRDDLRKELVDLASVMVAMIEAIDEGRFSVTERDGGDDALYSVMLIGDSYGGYAKAILERQEERKILAALTHMVAMTSSTIDDVLVKGYTPRSIEGSGDQESRNGE